MVAFISFSSFAPPEAFLFVTKPRPVGPALYRTTFLQLVSYLIGRDGLLLIRFV